MWSNFETSSLEDETISSIFSSRGMFRMRNEAKVENYPSLQACVQNKHMVIAIDKSFVLVEEEMETKCSFLSFNAKIDAFTISQSGNIIICGLSNGEVHGIYITGMPLFNVCIKVEDTPPTGKSFAIVQEISRRFHLVCTNGSVYRLCEIDENGLAKMSVLVNDGNESVSCNETLLEYVTVERLSNTRKLSDVDAALLISDPAYMDSDANDANDYDLIAGSNRNVFLINSRDSAAAVKLTVPEIYGGIKHIYNLDNYILLLTHSGHLLEFCAITKMICFSSHHSNDILIDELVIMESNDENIELLILTKESECDKTNNDCMRLMKFIQYPSFKCSYEFEVPKHSWIVQQPKCAVNLYYIRGNDLNAKDLPEEIEMMTVSETHPNERFKKLIAKGHLEEAEDYGKHFDLCLQPIYEAKAKHTLIQLCNLDDNNPELLNEQFNELTKLLELIEDRIFFQKIRMSNLPSRRVTQLFLKDILKRLDKEHDESDILEILEQLRRLETFHLIDPYECDADWQKFVYSSNLVKYLTSRLKTDILIACLIWKRHSSAIIPHLDKIDFEKLLSIITSNTEPFHLVQWLRQYVPIVSKIHPDTMPFITNWSVEKTRDLQHSEHWPDIGLEFSTKILEILQDVEYLHFDVRRQNEENIAKLQELVNALQELSVLKKSYNLIFTLDNYQQESLDETAFHILQRANLMHVKSIVNDFLYPIYQEQGKNPVNAIRRYIKVIVASRNSVSTWLERAVACIELLHDEDDRVECALSVLQYAPVPWPGTVNSLAKLRFSTHPLALKICGEFEKQNIKIMKTKYGWPTDSATDMNLNLFSMRIVKMDLPGMLDDIRMLTKVAPEISTSANFNCCYQLVCRGKSEIAFEHFKALCNEKTNEKCVNAVVEIFTDFLENTEFYSDERFLENQMHLIEFLKLITTKDSASAQMRLKCIVNRFTLFKRFNININSTEELLTHASRMKLLHIGIKKIISDSVSSECLNSNQNLTNFYMNELGELTTALEINKIIGIRLVCKELKCLPLICSLAYAVLESDEPIGHNDHNCIDLALDILSQQILADQNMPTNSALCGGDSDPLAFPLVFELLVRANLHTKNQALEITDILKYINIANMSYAINSIHNYYGGSQKNIDEINERISKFLSEKKLLANGDANSSLNSTIQQDIKAEKKRDSVSIFDDIDVQPIQKAQTLAMETSVMQFVSRTLLLLVLKAEPKNEIFQKLRNLLLKEDANLNATNASKNFFSSLKNLVKMKVHGVWYMMAQYIIDYQSNHDIKIIEPDFVSMQLGRVFRNLMTQNDCNFMDLLAMLIADDHTEYLFQSLEQDLKTDQQKYNYLTLLQMYNEYLGEKKEVEAIREKRLKQHYYMELCKKDPTIKGKFNIDLDNIDKLLKEFRHKQLDVYLIEQICRDFELDLNFMLILQVISILQGLEMQYEIKTDNSGDEELVMITTVDHIHSLCQPYINKISDTELLSVKLKQFIDEINIYFYELYVCVIEILSFIGTVPREMHIWISILKFLKQKLFKRRRNRPGQLETDMWLQSQSEIGVLPKIARFRLPFKPIVEKPLRDILDNELTVDNCESWFTLIDLHQMLKSSKEGSNMRSYFVMAAVRNCISEYKAKSDNESWQLRPTNNAFLKSILRLAQHIENPTKVFFLLYFVSSYAPEGADQVEATYECYKYAMENEQLIAEFQNKFVQVKRKYPILKTQHLLYR